MMIAANRESFSKIILAVDGSEHSLVATHYLDMLPIHQNCKICVLAVLDTPHTPRRQLLLAALEKACNILEEHHQDIEIGLLHGHPAASLVEFADNYQPNLIILGAKGLRATLGILLGGVAQQVVEYAHCPILVVRPLNPSPQRILLAVDGSKYSQAVLEYCKIHPFSPGDEFHVVHVIPPYPPYEHGGTARTWQIGTDVITQLPIVESDTSEEIRKNQETRGNEIIEAAIFSIEKLNHVVKSTLLKGDASTEILFYSKLNSIDIIIVGSRGLGEVKGWLLGSVSRKLVHYAPCSVLIVKH